jgi:hypothetical protein
MSMNKIKLVVVSVIAVFALMSTAGATEANPAQSKPKHRQVTGQVVSVSDTSIVVKGKTRGAVTLAVNEKTVFVGNKAAKAGERAAVKYRADKTGNTATKIKVIAEAPKTKAPL